jgi:hypothetical protein
MSDNKLAQKELKRILNYCPETGIFIWKIQANKNGAHIGDEAGWINQGHRYISISKRTYPAHRLAFLYMLGFLPPKHVDHINHIRNDNRWSNLRLASRTDNNRNQSLMPSNKTGIAGVSWFLAANKWRVYMNLEDRQIHLGLFDDFFEACCTRLSANLEHGFHENHGR